MKALRCGSVIWLFVLWSNPFCLAQVITIRVVDITNGHPVQKQQVSIQLLYDWGEKVHSNKAIPTLVTNSTGEAQFSLPEPAPGDLDINARVNPGQWRCGCWQEAKTEVVLQKGIVVPSVESKKKDVPVKAKPGEIVIPVRPLTFFERLLYPFVEG